MEKNLVITGGGRGIGHATAVLAAKAGWNVCVNYVGNHTRADETVALVEQAGAKGIAVQADITKEQDVIRLFETAMNALGPITGMVNSAGIVEPYGRVDELKYDELAALVDINVTAMMIVAREAIKHMSPKYGGEGGAIVMVSSASARIGMPGSCASYAASKGAVDSFSWGLAQEVAGENIRVNAVSPGVIDTEIQPAGRVETVGPNLPMGRAGQPEEVAQTIVWLLSDEASYVAGANVNISGAR